MLTSSLHEVSYIKYALQQGKIPPPSLNDQHGYRTLVRTSTGATPPRFFNIQHEVRVPHYNALVII